MITVVATESPFLNFIILTPIVILPLNGTSLPASLIACPCFDIAITAKLSSDFI